MANKMLIDAAHPEETRVVVLRGSRVEEFDFEAASKKQLRGNIYLAKVTRVEPSLQAAFVDYGGNRHGFLAFSEIHPDYYQIPVSDRQALIEAEAQDEPEEDERKPQKRSRRHRRERPVAADVHRNADEAVSEAAPSEETAATDAHAPHDRGAPEETLKSHDPEATEATRPVEIDAAHKPPYDDPTPSMIEHASVLHERLDDSGTAAAEPNAPAAAETPAHDAPIAEATTPAPAHKEPGDHTTAVDAEPAITSDLQVDTGSTESPAAGAHAHPDHETHGHETDHDHADDEHHAASDDSHDEHDDEHEEDVSEHVEQLGGDAMEEIPVRAYRSRRQYKIQEVIKRRQVLLVQVVKEERGNKGAALTTYLSLAGRYSVLMPNTAKGGGISRKITDAGDRQRLKSIAQDLEVPEGMGVILRTAGASRTKPEVKRDFEYLMRMWETVRETTLGSQAPTLVYEEGSLIKRAIRDLYNKDVDEVIVAGEAGYREAKDFMRMLMPSHARNVQAWRDPQPIFAKAGAEAQLDAMFSSHVTLKSGGYIVINQTEALVAIDVNSGRSTREHNIEDTALRTNLEAADEVARQLRLRDLAGLIVVDFIDMEEGRNNRAVEKRIKDALKNDRARIQVGRISHFGLLEMSRQRIRTGVLEGSTVVCEHCAGAGMVRSTSSIALHVLRVLEDTLILDAAYNITVRTRSLIALYILNQKRLHLADLEARFGVVVTFAGDESLTGTTYCAIERGEPATGIPQPVRQLPKYEADPAYDDEDEVVETEEDEVVETAEAEAESGTPETRETEAEGQRRKRRRRRRGRDRESSGISEDAPQPSDDALAFVADVDALRVDAESEDGEAVEREPGEASETGSGANTGRGEGRRRRSRRGGRRSREEQAPRDDGLVVAEAGGEHDHVAADDGGIPHGEIDHARVDRGEVDRGDVGHGEVEHGEPTRVPVTGEAAPTHDASSAPQPDAVAQQDAPAPAPVRDGDAKDDTVAATDVEPAPTPRPAASPEAPTAPQRPELVSSELDPAQPKRSGWWQRAKATLGG